MYPKDYIVWYKVGNKDYCSLGIEPDFEDDYGWTFGQTFMKVFYTVFDRDNERLGFVRGNN